MGQAKIRGTFEQRKEQAILKQEQQDIIDAEWRRNNPPKTGKGSALAMMMSLAAITLAGNNKL